MNIQYNIPSKSGKGNERTAGNMRSKSLLRAQEILPKESDDDVDAEIGKKGNE